MNNLADKHEEVSVALSALMDTVFSNPAIVSVTHSFQDSEPTILVGVLNELLADLPKTLSIPLDDKFTGEFLVKQYISRPIESDILAAEEAQRLLQIKQAATPTMGGDWCQNINSNGYGTVTVTASTVEVEGVDGAGHQKYHCVASPGMISNNHVIARSDQAQTGEQIKTASRDPFAQLSCFIPLGDTTINVDVAVAKIHDSSVTSFKQVKGLGQITGIRKPNPNEHIRKSGARTGVTAGSIIGRANIRSGGRTFYGTWRESNGMACPGDSGSPVVSDGMQLIGIHTWGSGDCNAQRECYFFDLVDQKQLAALFSRNDEDK